MALFDSEQTSSSSRSDRDPWDWFHSNGVSKTATAKANSSFNHLPSGCKDSIPAFSALQHFPSGFPKILTDISQCHPQCSNKADLAHQSHHTKIMELEAAAHPAAETPAPPFILPSTDAKKSIYHLEMWAPEESQHAGFVMCILQAERLSLNFLLLFHGMSKEGMQGH